MRTAFSLQIALPYANTAAAISKDSAIKLENPGAAAISDFATETKGTVFPFLFSYICMSKSRTNPVGATAESPAPTKAKMGDSAVAPTDKTRLIPFFKVL